MSKENSNFARIASISEALFYLSDAEPDEIFPEWLSPLVSAAKENQWDLIRRACELEEMHHKPDNNPERIKQEAKWIAYNIGTDSALYESPPTKAEILAIMENEYPEHYKALPSGPTSMRRFWKAIGEDFGQSRGGSPGSTPKSVRLYSDMKKDLGLRIQKSLERMDMEDEIR